MTGATPAGPGGPPGSGRPGSVRNWTLRAELARVNHAVDVIQGEFSRVRKTQWIRNAVTTFTGTFIAELYSFDAPITTKALVSLVLGALAAVPPVVDPKLNKATVERKLEELHALTTHGVMPDPPVSDTPPAQSSAKP